MKIFAYGSNMCMSRLTRRVASAKVHAAGNLRCHKFKIHKISKDGSGKANAFETQNESDIVIGVVYEIDADDKPELDKAEGLGNGYNEKVVSIELFNGETIEACIYVAADDAIDDTLKPYKWYMNYILTGAVNFHLPVEYINELSRITTIDDPDFSRNNRHDRRIKSNMICSHSNPTKNELQKN